MNMALKVNGRDNVATVFAEHAEAGQLIEVRDQKGEVRQIRALDAIPYGHKIAVGTIAEGEPIVKYGEEIGVSTQEIGIGNHVHVHNLDSMRGRGDLEKEENP